MSKLNEYLETVKHDNGQKGSGKHSPDDIMVILQDHVNGYGGPGPDYDDYVEFLDTFLNYMQRDILDFIEYLEDEQEDGSEQMRIDQLKSILNKRIKDF